MGHYGFTTSQRGIIEKIAKDNGWDLVSFDQDMRAILCSSRHENSILLAPIAGPNSDATCMSGLPHQVLQELALQAPDGMHSVLTFLELAIMLRRASSLLRSLPDTPLKTYEHTVAEILQEQPGIKGTEREAIVRQRVGQDCYRKALLDYWSKTCALTGLSIEPLLRASHAKPWADCTSDAERLSVFNGFLLSANADALFDRGLISFSDTGLLLTSPELDSDQLRRAGIPIPGQLQRLSDAHLPYLAWHRNHVATWASK